MEVPVNEDLKDIKARLDAAAPGPWRALTGAKQRASQASFDWTTCSGVTVSTPSGNFVFPLVLANDEHVLGELSAWTGDSERDLIVHARADMEYLYEEVLRARELLRAVLNDGEEYEVVNEARNYLTRVGFER